GPWRGSKTRVRNGWEGKGRLGFQKASLPYLPKRFRSSEGKAGLDSQKACLSEAPGSNSCRAKAGSGGSGLDSTRQFPRRAAGSSRLGAAAESSSSGSVSEIAASSSVGGK